jgi:hypothetical protein
LPYWEADYLKEGTAWSVETDIDVDGKENKGNRSRMRSMVISKMKAFGSMVF